MEEDTEYLKLPTEDKCVHKLWKARLSGYEEAAKLFRKIEDEKSPDWNKFTPLVKKFVTDSNAPAQEKGLEAVLAYVENCGAAGKTVADVMNGITQKCVAAPKARTKDLALQISLMYIEIEKQDAVIEELLKATESKNPKIVSASLNILSVALRCFGAKVINFNKILKRAPALMEDRDSNVRNEAKQLIVEIFRWAGQAIRPILSTIKTTGDLEQELEKVKDDHPRPSRLLRSQQTKTVNSVDEAAAGPGEEEADDGIVEADPYDFLDPVDILSKLPKDFYTQLEAKKWTERKEPLDILEKALATAPKLENADYGDLIRALKKIIVKDSNVVVVGIAIKCVTGLATGMKKKFHIYAGALIPSLLEKFKEKKQNIVLALREAVDAIYPATTLEILLEDLLAALDNKNPSVKAETVSFLARCFTKCTASILSKKLLKALSPAILKALNESDPTVRENAANALGTAMKVVGEKGITPYLGDIDSTKMAKIKEYHDKAELIVKVSIKKPSSAPSQSSPAKQSQSQKSGPVKPKSASVNKVKKIENLDSDNASKDSSALITQAQWKTLTPDDAISQAANVVSEEILSGLSNSDVNIRISAINELTSLVSSADVSDNLGGILLHVLNKDPGLKDPDTKLLQLRLNAMKKVSSSLPITIGSVDDVLLAVLHCFPDGKLNCLPHEVLTSICKATSLEYITVTILNENITSSPKIWAEALNWVSNAIIMKTGAPINNDFFISAGKRALDEKNISVRNAGLALIGTLHLQGNRDLKNIDPGKPLKVLDMVQPKDKFRSKESEKEVNLVENPHCDAAHTNEVTNNATEKISYVDIGPLLYDQLVAELCDKNWKVRAESVAKIQTIVTDARNITPNLGEVPLNLAPRIVDSNTKIASSAISLVESLAVSIGPSCKQYTKIFLPYLLKAIGDTKPWIRSAVLNCLNVWFNTGGYKEFFEGEIFAEALRSGSTSARTEIWAWLAEKLPQVKNLSKEDLLACLPILYNNLEDRYPDVRKNANEAVLGFMMHLGYSSMVLAADNLKSGNAGLSIKGVLEKVRGLLPEKPIAKTKNLPQIEKTSRPVKLVAGSSATIVKSKSKTNVKPGAQRKKEDEVDLGPLLQVNNLKSQRVVDEQKMKTLKWNFTSPRPEFVELLRDQMISANVNKSLIANMFHLDFKYHLRAIDSLYEDLPGNCEALMCNLDLILRWMTLRFFDTNPSVLLKGLEYLNMVFNILIEQGYNMLDNEAASFFPYLILKVGDPKDAVRNSVKAIFKQIGAVYPVSKQFSYVVEGLKSKNARQRTECLDQLGWLIENYGITVCHPTPAVSLKEIAKHIADRDTSVRNAALNCVVTAYFLEGEKILKMVGQISEKDTCLLEERIKRAAKNRPVASVKTLQSSVPVCSPLPPENAEVLDQTFEMDEIEENEEPLPTQVPTQIPTQVQASGFSQSIRIRPGSGPYGLDPNVLDEIECAHAQFQAPKLADIDLQFLKDSSANQPNVNPIPIAKVTPSLSKFTQPSTIKWELTQIASSDIEKAMSAMAQIDTILNSDKRNHMMGFVDFMVNQLVHQLIILNQSNHPDLVNCYRANFSLLMKLCNYQELCINISEQTLYKVLQQLLLLLTEHRFENLDRNDMFIRVVNSLVIRLLESTNKTNMLCALIKMVYDTMNNPVTTNHFQELVIKCLWKLNRTQQEWDSELNYVRILTEIHSFLRDYPTVWWKNQEADVPLRTVKTMLHSMVKIRGVEIKEHLKHVSGLTPDSEMYNYIKKVIKHLKVENPEKEAEVSHTQNSQFRFTKESHDELSEIFRMIGDAEDTTEGIRRLYEFNKAHPEVDTEPFLSKSTSVFQQYIRQGLSSFEMQNAKLENKQITKSEHGPAGEQGDEGANSAQKKIFTKEAECLWNRLQHLQEQAGCQSEKKTDKSRDNLKDHMETICNGSGDRLQQTANKTEFESIKQRLEYIKNNFANT